MKKLLFIIFCFLLFICIRADAFNAGIGGGAPAAGEEGETAADFTDDFTNTGSPPSGWTIVSGSAFSTDGGVIDEVGTEDGAVYDTNTSGLNQYACIMIADSNSGGLIFRSTGTGSDGHYGAIISYNDIYWTRMDNTGVIQDIGTEWATSLSANDYICATVQGINTAGMKLSVWNLGSSPCRLYPADMDNWCSESDAADYTNDTDPAAYYEGLKVGVGTYEYHGGGMDNWSGGSTD
jgi:hypothetical protein